MQNFAIEVPGEANPLTENTLLHVLSAAASTDPQQVQSGAKQLARWEKAAGFYKHLQSVFINKSLPVEVRYLAIIQLKNGIEKYWRKTAANAVSPEDRAVIRARLLESGLEEYDHRLALQNALVIAKISRFEYPNDWPDVISTLINLLRRSTQHDANPIHLPRTLLILLHITKELSTARLQKSRVALQAATPEIVQVLGQIYLEKVQSWQEALSSNAGDQATMQQNMEASLLAIKTLRRLFVVGYEFPNRESDVHQFWQLTYAQVGAFMNLISSQAATLPEELGVPLEKHLLQLSKLHLEMAKAHPAAFVLLPNSLDLVRSYWALIKQFGQTFGSSLISGGSTGDQGEQKPFQEKVSLSGLKLIRACIKMVFNPVQSFKYKHPQDKIEKAEAIAAVKEQLLTEVFVTEVMEVVVTKFFVFRQGELQEWEEDPEEWEQSLEGESEGWEYSVRPCAEKLFLDLALNFRDLLTQPLLNVFYTVAAPDNEDVLFKDSVYTAIGLAAAVLQQHLDFDSFLSNTIVVEVQKQKPGFNILRRRIAILLGQWITVKVSAENRPLVYKIFQHMLDPSDSCNDQVVRITAGRQFKNIVDDWEFSPKQFLPYVQTTMTQLLGLIEEVDNVETKMALLNTISVLVERLEHHIAPYAETIINILPNLWEQSGDEHLMKQAILTILSRLVTSMKAASVPFHHLVLPIIKGAVEPGSDTQVYLLDDALDLWANILIQTPAPASPELLQLAPYLFSIFELGSENLRTALDITSSYFLLAPSEMLSDEMRKPLISSLSTLVGYVKADASGTVNNLVELIIRAAEGIGGEAAISTIASDLVESKFLNKQLEGLRGSWVAHCTTGPLAKDPLVDGIVETDYLSVLARVLMGSETVFLQAVQAAAPSIPLSDTATQPSLDETMKWLLEEWFSHFESIGDPSRRKLMCLAITKLLSTSQPFILGSLQSLMTMWTDMVNEIREEDGPVDSDTLVYENMDQLRNTDSDVPEAPEDERRRALTFADPVHNVRTTQWIKHYLQTAIQAAGGQEAFQNEWLINVDKDVIAAFGTLGIM
ncbi:ARM repeat-containing protein [Aureobasidium pullulans]|uniref:ARM repeat-containing protein n=1 Tax=Aureobasidium pullulans TaxID=5580 RepID=A0A4S9Y6K0_AURPU|nr:ARM repeat-containing protein [Aureobasidium pullulans]